MEIVAAACLAFLFACFVVSLVMLMVAIFEAL